MSQIPIEKQVFDKQNFVKVVDTQFHQLYNSQLADNLESFTIDDFFQLYEQLFYQIPKEGATNSHRYILEKEADYLGVIVNQEDIQALLDEITNLRQQVLDSQTAFNEIAATVKSIK
jgi:hypothetical protein